MLIKDIKTERLIIKIPVIDDRFELTQLINDKHVIKWLSDMPFPYTLSHAEEFIERSQEKAMKGETYNFMIFKEKKNSRRNRFNRIQKKIMRTWILAGKKVLGKWLCYRSCEKHLRFWV